MRSPRALLLAAAFVLASCATVPPPPARFKILQINDVYKIEGLEDGQSGGMARIRTLRKHLESDGTPVLLLHAGDLLYPSVMSKYLDARPMIDVMNRLDGDPAKPDPSLFVTFGNHEFDKSAPDVLLGRLQESSFQWLATNTRRCNPDCDQRFPNTTEVFLGEVGGTTVGIFGLLYPLRKSYVQSTDPIEAARLAVDALRRRGADVVIALTHQDLPDDVKLVQQVPGIDLVIGGHDHLFTQQQVDGKWITKADADAKSVIVYDVTVRGDRTVRTTPVRMMLDHTVPRDPDVDGVVQRWLTELYTKLPEKRVCEIGRTKYVLEGVEPAVRGRETALGNLLTDVMRRNLRTDIAFLNGGGIRINDDIRPGPITNYHLEGVFFYNNDLVSFPLKGSEILEILDNSVSRADAGDGRFLQISGFSFRYRREGDRYIVSDVRVGGEPLDPAKTYTAATVNFLYDGEKEDDYAIFSTGRRPPEIARIKDFMKLTRDAIKEVGTVTADVEGRIVRADATPREPVLPCD